MELSDKIDSYFLFFACRIPRQFTIWPTQSISIAPAASTVAVPRMPLRSTTRIRTRQLRCWRRRRATRSTSFRQRPVRLELSARRRFTPSVHSCLRASPSRCPLHRTRCRPARWEMELEQELELQQQPEQVGQATWKARWDCRAASCHVDGASGTFSNRWWVSRPAAAAAARERVSGKGSGIGIGIRGASQLIRDPLRRRYALREHLPNRMSFCAIPRGNS